MSRLNALWILIAIIAVGIGLRGYHLTERSIWFDEAFSWRTVQFPMSEMMSRIQADVHPPLYYVLLKGWTYVFSGSAFAIRSFSVTFAGLSLASAYLFASYAFKSRRVGLMAATFLAISPWVSFYGWEARMYPLGMTWALLSSYALLRAIRTTSLLWSVLYGVLAVALIYTHYYGFFTLAAHALVVLGVLIYRTKWRPGELFHDRIWWGAVTATAIILVLYSFWLPTFLRQREQVEESYWVPPVTAHSIPDTLYKIVAPTQQPVSYEGAQALLSYAPLVGVIVLCAYAVIRFPKHEGLWITVLSGAVPFVCAAGISLFERSVYNDRFLAYAGIFLFIVAAYAIDRIRQQALRFGVFVVAIVFLVVTFVLYAQELSISSKPGVQAAVNYVFEHRSADQQVIVQSPYVFFPVLHYATEKFRSADAVHLYSSDRELTHFGGGPVIKSTDIVTPEDIASYTGTVWVIDTTGFSEKFFEAPSSWKEVDQRSFSEVFGYQGDIIVRELRVIDRK